MKKQLSEIGVAGLAVMGENLALNLANHHFRVSAWNRSYEKTAAFLERAGSLPVTGCRTPEEFVASLEQPRRILLMVKAGRAVDDCIEAFLPHLDPGDILMDGGNSLYLDTVRRERALGERGIRFLGVGISGGEEGALHGPSIMPGGDAGAWPCVKKYLQTIAAQVDGVPCCDWVGPEGSGHYVKMVHNGIEYADMELISEAYAFMRDYLRLDNSCMEKVFSRWSKGVLSGYLLDITAQIFRRGDPEGEGLLLDRILDAPGQKGTGRWTGVAALETGTPAPVITDAVFQRSLNADVELRARGAELLPGVESTPPVDRTAALADLEAALYAAKICAYAQGFALLAAAEKNYGWKLNYGGIALMWRGGCIIRARFLDDIKAAYDRKPELENLMFDEFFRQALAVNLPGFRRSVAAASLAGVPMPCMAGALNYFDSCRTRRSAGNLLQAQRDFFGAHRYERVDRPRGETFHTEWI